MPRREQDVLGLDVTVNDPVLVGIVQGVSRIARDPECIGHGQLLLPVQPIAQRLAFDVRHGEPELVSRFTGVEDRQDVGMLESRRKPDLALEALRAEHRRDLGVQDLERHRAVMPKVAREKYRGHAAATELALDRIAASQGAFQHRAEVRHVAA